MRTTISTNRVFFSRIKYAGPGLAALWWLTSQPDEQIREWKFTEIKKMSSSLCKILIELYRNPSKKWVLSRNWFQTLFSWFCTLSSWKTKTRMIISHGRITWAHLDSLWNVLIKKITFIVKMISFHTYFQKVVLGQAGSGELKLGQLWYHFSSESVSREDTKLCTRLNLKNMLLWIINTGAQHGASC